MSSNHKYARYLRAIETSEGREELVCRLGHAGFFDNKAAADRFGVWLEMKNQRRRLPQEVEACLDQAFEALDSLEKTAAVSAAAALMWDSRLAVQTRVLELERSVECAELQAAQLAEESKVAVPWLATMPMDCLIRSFTRKLAATAAREWLLKTQLPALKDDLRALRANMAARDAEAGGVAE
jgi:hypothetical protein